MIKLFKSNRELEDGEYFNNYYDTCILNSGQMIKIEFQEDRSNDKYYYNIYLVISNKRKSTKNTYLKSTGKDGLKGLFWAKKKIIEFESFIKEKNKDVPIVIIARWDDNRRRNVYERGLKNLGYKYNMIFGSKALSKTI